MIESRGGVVSEEIYEGNDASGTFLVADTYYRTHKYLFALAADIPCVHYNWIEKCVESVSSIRFIFVIFRTNLFLMNNFCCPLEFQFWMTRSISGKLNF